RGPAGLRAADGGAAAEGDPPGVAGGGVAMNREESSGFGGLPVLLVYHINRVCDGHEAAWRAGQRPRIEDALADESGSARAVLLRELLAVELAARRQVGEAPDRREYRDRFPGDAGLIEIVFAEAGLSTERPATGPPTPPAGAEPRGPAGTCHE